MPILIADSNFLQKPALREFFAASTSNKIAVSEEVLVEMHKREPRLTVTKNLELAREYPGQVVVLRGVTGIYGLPINSAMDARKLIDSRQTARFAQWYDDVLQAEDDDAMGMLIANAQKQAQAQIEEIASAVKHIKPIFRNMKKRFDNEELAQLRKRIPYSESTQRKLLDIMFGVSRALFVNAKVPAHLYPHFNGHAFRYFIFRYAMCMTLLYTRWVHFGNFSDDINKLVNHVVDMHLAALGTFFSGVLSDDEMLIDVHREARWLLRTTGSAFVG
jgi:Xaa-Pro aminopeptidase